jgi:transposase InsO family protein
LRYIRGALPLCSNVVAILQHPEPHNVQQLQAFLGLVNFYRRFIPAAAKILKPLTDLLIGGPKGKAPIHLEGDSARAFQTAKEALSSVTTLVHPAEKHQISLMVDASADHVGGALQQRRSARHPWQPLGFFSRKLSAAQQRYSAFDRELLACVSAIRHFRFMLEGREFTLYTDHKPLTSSLRRTSDPWTSKQCRHLAYIAEFTGDIQHIAGGDNLVADSLSRPPPLRIVAALQPATDVVVDLAAVALHQTSCPVTTKTASSPSLQIESRIVDGKNLLCDVSRGKIRPLVPLTDRRLIFSAFHNIAHPGIRATRRLIAERFMWRGMNSDVAEWCKDCQQCQTAKVTRQGKAAVQPIAIPRRRFSHIHADIVGPLPSSTEGFQYLLTVVDRSTRWLEAIPLRSVTATAVADALVAGWISRFGVPAEITTDRGVQFQSAIWQYLCRRLGMVHSPTTAYHPQANGMVERYHRQLKEALKARLAGNQWPDHLPWVLMGLRAATKEDSGVSSAELVLGSPLVLPGQFVDSPEPPAADFLRDLRIAPPPPPTRPLPADRTASSVPPSLQTAAFVYVRRGGVSPALTPPYTGPFRVVRPGSKTFVVAVGNRFEVITLDRLKPHLGTLPVLPASPPPRGRPPASPPTVTAPADQQLGGEPL